MTNHKFSSIFINFIDCGGRQSITIIKKLVKGKELKEWHHVYVQEVDMLYKSQNIHWEKHFTDPHTSFTEYFEHIQNTVTQEKTP